MLQYQQGFSQATQAINDLLTSMEQHLHHYAGMTTQRLESVGQTAETHLAQAARRLGDTVNGLEARLRGFTESLERLPQGGEVHGSPGR